MESNDQGYPIVFDKPFMPGKYSLIQVTKSLAENIRQSKTLVSLFRSNFRNYVLALLFDLVQKITFVFAQILKHIELKKSKQRIHFLLRIKLNPRMMENLKNIRFGCVCYDTIL